MSRGGFRSVGPRRLLPGGMALSARAVGLVRAHRRQVDFGEAAGISERTIRRMEEKGATLTQAMALAGAEIERGDVQSAAYILSMIGETLDLAPAWGAPTRWDR